MNITNRNYTQTETILMRLPVYKSYIHQVNEAYSSCSWAPTEGVKFTAPEYTREPYNGGPI